MMKKRELLKRKDNVIFFPGFEKRLISKGIENLHNKKFSDAIDLLELAREYDPDNDEILIGLVMAYFEASAFEKAREIAKEILLKGVGDYFQMVDLYLTVLIQLHEYEEIITTIELLLDEKEVPPDKFDHFLTILQFSKKMLQNPAPAVERKQQKEENNPQKLNLFSLNGVNEQMLLVSNLAEKNIRPYFQEIAEYLRAKTGNFFLKTILLTLLKEQEIDSPVTVNKFEVRKNVIPVKLPEVRQQPKMLEVKAALENHLESRNPVLYQNIITLVERIFFISYPMELEPANAFAWAAAFHFLAEEYHGFQSEIAEVAKEYEVEPEEMEQAIRQVERIEEISYPNL